MKKVLVVLFLLLGVIAYTKPYYSNGKKEKIQTAVPTNMAALNKPKAATSMLPSSDTSDDDGGDIDFDLDL